MDDNQQNFKKAIKMVADHIESILLSLILFISYALLVFTNADAVAGIVFILPMVAVALTRGVKDEFDSKKVASMHYVAMLLGMVIIFVQMYNGIKGYSNYAIYATVVYPVYELIYARIKWQLK